MRKEELRVIYKEKRASMSIQEIEISSKKIHDLLFSRIMIHRFSPIHLFLTIKRKSEPDTSLIINTLNKDFMPDIYISKTVPPNNLLHFLYNNETLLETSTLGIDEPTDDGSGMDSEKFFTEYANEDILIIVPLLIFDKSGHRVGYGKGYYDHFLKFKTQNTTLIGLSFFEPVDEITDINPNDVPLNYCISPDRVWSFNSK